MNTRPQSSSIATALLALAAFGRGWSLTPFPLEYNTQFFERVSIETPKYILNSFVYCGIDVTICIAYVRAFYYPLPFIGTALTSMWINLPLVLAMRRLPYTVRGSYASLLLVHKSMEEAASSVGAMQMRIFRDITFPVVWKGILVGALFSFMTSLQEASASLFLTLGGWEMMPFGIFTFYIAGSQNEAAALGFILIMVAAVSLFVINRIASTKFGGLFG